GVHATLSTSTPGANVIVAQQPFASIAPLASVANAVPFKIALDPGFVPGTDVDLLLTVDTDHGQALLRRRIATGSPGTTVALINEDFNPGTGSTLPAGWSSVVAQGATVAWIASTTFPGVGGTGSRAAFHTNSTSSGWNRLFSPVVVVPTPAAGAQCYVTLDFDVAYSLENEPTRPNTGYDGCYVRITDMTGGSYTVRSIYATDFADAMTTGSPQGYPPRLPRTLTFATADMWSGSSQGLKHVSMKFPGEGLAGHSIQLRFEYIQDNSGTCTTAGLTGPCGISIDN